MKTTIIKDNIDLASTLIKSGELVAVPTETVYGLAGNGLDAEAVEKIYEVKGRPQVKPLALMIPDSGSITVNGERVGVDVDFPRDMGLIIETPGFLPNVTGMKNLEILASLNKKIGLREIAASMRAAGLDPSMNKPVGKYSLGMRQRLGIAQAIMENPSLLILDEPLNGLDKHGVTEMRQLIKGLKEQGKTILLASHNQGDIDELCDTVCEMDAGVMTIIREESI